jgi:hypothetical protein
MMEIDNKRLVEIISVYRSISKSEFEMAVVEWKSQVSVALQKLEWEVWTTSGTNVYVDHIQYLFSHKPIDVDKYYEDLLKLYENKEIDECYVYTDDYFRIINNTHQWRREAKETNSRYMFKFVKSENNETSSTCEKLS